MPTRIDNLTPSQESAIKNWVKDWIAFGLSTEPADRPRFEKAIRNCYKFANLDDNIPIVWVNSPVVGAFAAPIAANFLEIINKEKIKIHDSAVHSAVYSAVYSEVYSAVRSAIDSAVHSEVYSEVQSKKIFWHHWLGGCFWISWSSYTQFLFEVCGLDLGEINVKAKNYAELSLTGCYSWPNKNFIMACEKPNKISRDSNGKLHCEDSMAITWPDSWGLFMWHGIRVPPKLIMDPFSITKEELGKETNSEISRAWLERLGPKEYFKRMEVKKIDAWIDNATGLHYELFDFINRRGELQPRVLKMESPKLNDGTQPVYIEMVDPKLETARAARRWQFQKEDGTWPSVEECNKNPSLVFGWEA